MVSFTFLIAVRAARRQMATDTDSSGIGIRFLFQRWGFQDKRKEVDMA
jgi:hypothetical protein